MKNRDKNGQFTKGNNAGGRTKGSKNKTTQKIREAFHYFIDNNLDRMQEDINSLEPKDRLEVILKISKFVLPTLRATDLKMEDERVSGFKIEIVPPEEYDG